MLGAEVNVVAPKTLLPHSIEKLGVKEITFWDDTLSYHKKWMREFLDLLIKENLDLSWSCYAAVNTVDKEILQLMSKAGCWNIFYGFETAVDELAENISKIKEAKMSLNQNINQPEEGL